MNLSTMTDKPTKVKSNLAKYRNKKGYSQEDLARLIGVSKTTIQSWENERGMTSAMRFLKLCTELDTDIREIFILEE